MLLTTLSGMFQYDFMQNAFLAGSVVAILAAIVGYFVVLRGLSFAAHALSHIGFAGAAGAVWLGASPLAGLLVFTVVAGVAIGALGDRVRGRDVAIGIVLAFALGLGSLFLALYTRYATEAFSILFGTILGISRSDVLSTTLLGAICLVALGVIARPLLFASVDPDVAEARGVPVGALSIIFLVILAVVVAVAVQVVGVLLLFSLLVAPAAAGASLTARPGRALLLGIVFALLETWLGISLSYVISWPPSFFISTAAVIVYLGARGYATMRPERRPQGSVLATASTTPTR